MAAKPFGIQMGRRHFPQVKNEHLASFVQAHYIIEVSPGITVDQLLDCMIWGPQPGIKRLDRVSVLAADNSYYVELLCIGSSATFPLFRILSASHADIAAEPLMGGGADRIEFQPILGWIVVAGGDVVASRLPDREAALAALNEHRAMQKASAA